MAAGRLVYVGFMPAIDPDGVPYPDARFTVYQNRTTTLAVIYADEALTTPLANPVLADSSGQFPPVWQDDGLLFSASISSLAQPLAETIDDLSPSTSVGGAANKLDRDGGNPEPDFLTNVGAAALTYVDSEVANVLAIIQKPRIRSVFEDMSDAEIADVTSGSAPTLDVASKFNAWIAYCEANGYVGRLPQGRYRLGSKIISPANVSVQCEADGSLEWTTLANYGWKVDGQGLGGEAGYCEVELPRLVGPNNFGDASVPSGYYATPKNYDLSGYTGVGLEVANCIWGDFKFQNALGCGDAIRFSAPNSLCDNLTAELGTIDLCRVGVHFYGPSGSAAPVGQIKVNTLNIFAYRGVQYTGGGSTGIFECHADVLGVLVNQTGGHGIYLDGTIITDCSFRGKVQNRYIAGDSPATAPNITPTDLAGPLIGGNQTILGESGWGSALRFTAEVTRTNPAPYAAGNSVAVKLTGEGSKAWLVSPEGSDAAPVALSQTQGEANYNGGVGGASMRRKTYVSVDLNGMASSTTVGRRYYFYHQGLNPTNINPIGAQQQNQFLGVGIFPKNNNAVVPREVFVDIFNTSGSTITSPNNVLNFWLEVS